LLQQGSRLLTPTAPGGSGKTRLPPDAAATLVPEFKAGVFWVGLATVRDPTLVTDEIAQTLGAKDGLREHIGERELLLLLDNLEQVVDAAPGLASLVETCLNLKLLVTSRELLRVRGEIEYAVLPLGDPEAVALFSARAGTDGDETVHELCRALDNLPLAVELAAARARVLTPSQILERLGQRLDLLKGGRDADPRQQTLRATIEWSYGLLTPEEQRLFARLAVFAGGFTLDVAEHVTDADVDLLQSLVEKSLVRRTEERFWMLETIREYAVERLDDSGEAQKLRRRHAEHFVALAEEAEPHLRQGSGSGSTGWTRITTTSGLPSTGSRPRGTRSLARGWRRRSGICGRCGRTSRKGAAAWRAPSPAMRNAPLCAHASSRVHRTWRSTLVKMWPPCSGPVKGSSSIASSAMNMASRTASSSSALLTRSTANGRRRTTASWSASASSGRSVTTATP